MSEEVSLYDLLNLSIGTPQKSSVNFGALHSLLLAMLKQLNLREVKTRWRDSSPGYWSPDLTAAEKEVQVEVQPDTDFQNRAATPSCPGPIPDQLNLLSRIQTCEDGLSKVKYSKTTLKKNHLWSLRNTSESVWWYTISGRLNINSYTSYI